VTGSSTALTNKGERPARARARSVAKCFVLSASPDPPTSDQRVGGSNPSGRATFPRETVRLFEVEGHRTACSGTIRHRDCYIDCYIDGCRNGAARAGGRTLLVPNSAPESSWRALRGIVFPPVSELAERVV
jgi:hypothetical protein